MMRLVDDGLATGLSLRAIERLAKQKGSALKAEAVAVHLKDCHQGIRPEVDATEVLEEQQTMVPPPLTRPVGPHQVETPKDLARLVQQKAIEGLERGSLQVTLKDGLSATALIDKREARQEDRRFMVGLARLLSGAGYAGPMGDDPDVIDVSPNPLLAPPELRGDD